MKKRLLWGGMFVVVIAIGTVTAYATLHKNHVNYSANYSVGDTFTVKLDGPYWDGLSFSSQGIVEQVNINPTTCPVEFGCKSQTFTLRAIKKGRVIVSSSRPQCGEAAPCQGNNGQFREEVIIH